MSWYKVSSSARSTFVEADCLHNTEGTGAFDVGAARGLKPPMVASQVTEEEARASQCCWRDYDFDGNCDRHPPKRGVIEL